LAEKIPRWQLGLQAGDKRGAAGYFFKGEAWANL